MAASIPRQGDAAQDRIFDANSRSFYLLIGHLGGAPAACSVQDTYAYVGFGPELTILDVADPGHPVRVGYIVLPHQLADVYVAGTRAYVLDTPDDFAEIGFLYVVDIGTPQTPQLLGSYQLDVSPAAVVVAGDCAYVVNGWNGLDIFDVQ